MFLSFLRSSNNNSVEEFSSLPDFNDPETENETETDSDTDLDNDNDNYSNFNLSDSYSFSLPYSLQILLFSFSRPSSTFSFDWRDWFFAFFLLSFGSLTGFYFVINSNQSINDLFISSHSQYFSSSFLSFKNFEFSSSPIFCLSLSISLAASLSVGGIILIYFGLIYCFTVIFHLIFSFSSIYYYYLISFPYFIFRYFFSFFLFFLALAALAEPQKSKCQEIERWAFVIEGFIIGITISVAATRNVIKFFTKRK